MDKNNKEMYQDFLLGEIRDLDRSNNKMDKEILVGNIAANIVGGLIMNISPNIGLGMLIATPFVVGFSLCDYMHLRKNQQLKDMLPEFFVTYTKSMSEKNIENYKNALNEDNKKVRILTLLGTMVGGLTAGYSIGSLFSGDLEWLAGLGMGTMTAYGSYKFYKTKSKRFGDKVKFKYEEEIER